MSLGLVFGDYTIFTVIEVITLGKEKITKLCYMIKDKLNACIVCIIYIIPMLIINDTFQDSDGDLLPLVLDALNEV